MLFWVFVAFLAIAEGLDAASSTPTPKAEKHASELDLGCSSYVDTVDWVIIKKQVKTFLTRPSDQHEFLADNLRIARQQRHSDCYLGLCSLGYLALLFMDPERRAKALKTTLFGSVPLGDQIPLSYWDTIASGWPIFGLLELAGAEVRRDGSAPLGSLGRCCEDLSDQGDATFLSVLQDALSRGVLVRFSVALDYLAASPSRCSWGKACAYFALAERLLYTRTGIGKQAAKDLMVLGELQLSRCAPKSVTVHEQMLSSWPFWSFLRRIEAEGLVDVASQMLRLPPGYQAPRAALHGKAPLRQAAGRKPRGARHRGVALCGARDVHIALSGDKRHAEGLLAAVNSAVAATGTPSRLCLHVFCLVSEASFFREAFWCSFRGRLLHLVDGDRDAFSLHGAAVVLHTFDAKDVLSTGLAVDDGVTLEAGNLNAPHNFVRFHLARWLPPVEVPRLIYLDTDVIVRGDLCDLFDTSSDDGAFSSIVSAVPRRHLPLSVYLKVFSPRMPLWLPSSAPSFNAGVMIISLRAWDAHNITGHVEAWALRNGGHELWRLGSQPPLLLLLHDRVRWLDDAWNVDGLGHHMEHTTERLLGARILHWTGPLKPWAVNGLHQDLWEPHAVHCWRGAAGRVPS